MTSPSYFHDLYERSEDPWRLAEREYELRKFEVTAASLPRRRYARGFEPACSIGVLTRLLAARCDELIASDSVERAVRSARENIDDPSVEFTVGAIPHDWPSGEFNLIVISEILYFLSTEDRHGVLEKCRSSLSADGHLVAVHWRHPFEQAVCTGDEAHVEIAAWPDLSPVVQHLEPDFRLEVFARA